MSSRDYRRRERSWEREDRGDRYSRGSRNYRDEPRRSRSPRRRSRSRSPRRGDRDRRDHRDRDDRRERDSRRRDDRDRSRERERDRDRERKDEPSESPRQEVPPPRDSTYADTSTSRPDSEYFSNEARAGEDDDAAMMALMGMAGFGSTKGKHVEGNQEGTVNIKKQRTWRQYMNRRGGFNRPLDKIK